MAKSEVATLILRDKYQRMLVTIVLCAGEKGISVSLAEGKGAGGVVLLAMTESV
jgi:hypothetical protein